MYSRKAYIEVFNKKDDTTPSMVIEGLRITGEVQYKYDSSDVIARLVVYNLSLENRKALLVKDKSTRDLAPDGKSVVASSYIKLYAGHVDENFVGGEKPLILQGPIMNVFSFSKRPEVHTVMYVVPSGQSASYNHIDQFEAGENMTLGEAITKIGNLGGYEVVDISRLPSFVRNESVRGMVFGQEVSLQREMFKLGKTYHFMTRYNAGKMVVKLKENIPTEYAEIHEVSVEGHPNIEVLQRGIVTAQAIDTYVISVDKIRENPRVGSASLKLSVILAPEMENIEVLDLREVKGLLSFDDIGDPLYRDDAARKYLVSDFYRVSGITHVFDTHGQAWHTYVEAHMLFEGLHIRGS